MYVIDPQDTVEEETDGQEPEAVISVKENGRNACL